MTHHGIQRCPVTLQNGAQQNELFKYFQQFTESENGLKECCSWLLGNGCQDDDTYFFILKVIEHHLRHRHNTMTAAERQFVKNQLMSWASKVVADGTCKTYVSNKTAQVLCLMFLNDYPHQWSSFGEYATGLTQFGPGGVDLYLRTLLAIDEEVVDRHIPHTLEEAKRNTLIKDTMRDDCIPKMVESWYYILSTLSTSNPELSSMCMRVVGRFSAWIDINMIVCDRFVSLLLKEVGKPGHREAAVECFTNIICKGMDPLGKVRLVDALTTVLEQSGILPPSVDCDEDFLVLLGGLLNSMGIQLSENYTKQSKAGDTETREKVLQSIELKVPYLHSFLNHDCDEVSASVVEFSRSYLLLLKQLPALTLFQHQVIETILKVVVNKMKYTDEYDFDAEGETEAEFVNFRKQIKVLLVNIAHLVPHLVTRTTRDLFLTNVPKWKSLQFIEVEIALNLLFLLGEAFSAQQLTTDPTKLVLIQELLAVMMHSGVLACNHKSVQLLVFENMVRFEKHFVMDIQQLRAAYDAFVSPLGVENPNRSVRSRTCYLLNRFLKNHRLQVPLLYESILPPLTALLLTAADGSEGIPFLSNSDRCYLYEVVVTLVTGSGTNPASQRTYIEKVFIPVLQGFSVSLENLSRDPYSVKESSHYAELCAGYIENITRSSKPFTSPSAVRNSGCVEFFKEATALFLRALVVPVYRDLLHNSVRQYLHRMIICLGEDLLPFLPVAIAHLLQGSRTTDIAEFMPLMNQLISRFKAQVSSFLLEVFVPLVQCIFSSLSTPADPADEQANMDRLQLKRAYFLFLHTIIYNGIQEVIFSRELVIVQQVLGTVVEAAADLPDLACQKHCFSILCKLVENMGAETILSDFRDFVQNIIRVCVVAPMRESFDLTDAMSIQVIQDIGNTFKSLYTKVGPDLIAYMKTILLPQLEFPDPVAVDFCQAIATMESKQLRNYLKAFYTSCRR